jgi:UTP:GlnB (protein PII) uridylyltransferase
VAKEQINVRISETGRALLAALVEHFSNKQADAGRRATQAEVVERAMRLLAAREKILMKSPKRD